jgi:hypothetical protein
LITIIGEEREPAAIPMLPLRASASENRRSEIRLGSIRPKSRRILLIAANSPVVSALAS